MRTASSWSKTEPRHEARNTDSSQLWKVMKEWRWKREIKAACETFFLWEPTAPSALRLPAQHAPVSAATNSNTTASATNWQWGRMQIHFRVNNNEKELLMPHVCLWARFLLCAWNTSLPINSGKCAMRMSTRGWERCWDSRKTSETAQQGVFHQPGNSQ